MPYFQNFYANFKKDEQQLKKPSVNSFKKIKNYRSVLLSNKITCILIQSPRNLNNRLHLQLILLNWTILIEHLLMDLYQKNSLFFHT